ncbi:coiled-coil protein [Legionella beliardensis]|uniref:Coiled-coil protein n=1 Tax=Legionella beliardensis TaxID=91822 RepID=A0A378HXL4_9GAMM|nr:LbtU family siderophore porin [Legionella beliardensis]STX27619.1 coiled-coil protein [Legionella beliardensis]
MKPKAIILALATIPLSTPLIASQDQLQERIQQLQEQTNALQKELVTLKKQMAKKSVKSEPPVSKRQNSVPAKKPPKLAALSVNSVTPAPKAPPNIQSGRVVNFHESHLVVHTVESHPESISFYPTALVADNQIITYIAGTPVVTSPYLGDRPAFDGSDYIVNISSINRDIRLMQQRRRLFRAYEGIGYPAPNVPILAISGKTEPVAVFNRPQMGNSQGDFNLGSSELDVAAILNRDVEAFISIAYDESPPLVGPRVSNSVFNLNLGFVNIGDLDKSPFYLTAGQLFAPYGRFASSMISAPLTMTLARIKTRPVILGYKSQNDPGPYAAVYGFVTDTTLGHDGVGGVNLGYVFGSGDIIGDIGGGLVGSLADSQGMQNNGSPPLTTFGGFGSPTNGTEQVRKIPGINLHGNVSFDRYSLTAEWVGASRAFRAQDLSFNGKGAKPQAIQLEGGMTFRAFDKPASLAAGYQWSNDALALNLPKHRVSGVFNISIWKDTVESLEYRHDIDYGANTYANGAAPPGIINANTLGTGRSSDTVVAQIGVYF